MKDEFYFPTKWRAQDTKNKQGSVSADLAHKEISDHFKISCEDAMKSYRVMLGSGVAREMARMILPVALYSEMYFSCNARSLSYFVALRSDIHAQAETRQYAHALALMFEECMPWTFAALRAQLESRANRDYSELWQFRDELLKAEAS